MTFAKRKFHLRGTIQISIVTILKKYHPSRNVKFNNLGIFQSLKLCILMEKILSIQAKFNSKYLWRLWANLGSVWALCLTYGFIACWIGWTVGNSTVQFTRLNFPWKKGWNQTFDISLFISFVLSALIRLPLVFCTLSHVDNTQTALSLRSGKRFFPD